MARDWQCQKLTSVKAEPGGGSQGSKGKGMNLNMQLSLECLQLLPDVFRDVASALTMPFPLGGQKATYRTGWHYLLLFCYYIESVVL